MSRLHCASSHKSSPTSSGGDVPLGRFGTAEFSPFCNRLLLLDSLVMSPILKPALRKMRLVPLIAATYFMVSGGPYGIEDILGGAGYGWAIAILLVLPFRSEERA